MNFSLMDGKTSPLGYIEQTIVLLPEFSAMKDTIEENPWHDHQSVYDHTMQVVGALKNYSKKRLLIMAAFLHDIGKPDTISIDPETGWTVCIDHENVGSHKIPEIAKRLELTKKDTQYLIYMTKYHGTTHEMVNTILEKGTDNPYARKFFKKNRIFSHDLLTLALADTKGCNLRISDPEGFEKRIQILSRLLKKARF